MRASIRDQLAQMSRGERWAQGGIAGAENVRDWLDAHPLTQRRGATRGGVDFDTPWEQADALARAFVPALEGRLWWGDPCCGVGRLMIATLDALADRCDPAALAVAVRRARVGDIDAEAAALAVEAIGRWCLGWAKRGGRESNDARVLCAAALEIPQPEQSVFDWPAASGGAVITNPPFESIRSLHRRLGKTAVDELRDGFDVCQGAFDLGVPVVARCLQLAQGGALALVAPSRWLSAAYAERLRTALDGFGCWQRIASSDRPFDASVDVLLAVSNADFDRAAEPPTRDRAGFRWHARDELPPGCDALGEIATVMSGTPGFDARRVSDALLPEHECDRQSWRFYSAASVQAPETPEGVGSLSHGEVRLCGRTLQRPMLSRTAVTSRRRAAFYDAPKFIVPGVARRLIAAWSDEPAALSVGVVGVIPHTAADRHRIEEALASEASQAWLDRVAPGRALSGGFQRYPAGLLVRLPVPKGA